MRPVFQAAWCRAHWDAARAWGWEPDLPDEHGVLDHRSPAFTRELGAWLRGEIPPGPGATAS